MHQIFVNLKRFEVPKSRGGLCPVDDPTAWIEAVVTETAAAGLGGHVGLCLVYLLPEGLVPAAVRAVRRLDAASVLGLSVGCQGVHWEDIRPGANFGAYTTSLPAAAAANLGARWAIIGHSEERRAKLQVLQNYDARVETDSALRLQANQAVDRLVQAEVDCALAAGLNVLLCVGESAEERGGGSFAEQRPRVEAVLKRQLLTGLQNAAGPLEAGRVVIGYEPIWAIGPGKIPPGEEYIRFVSTAIKEILSAHFGSAAPVVYGGGLKEENAAMIAGIATIDGGLVALTRFTGEIGFDVPGLQGIVAKYLALAG
jgi:triosephosphate isomerase